MIMAFNFVSIVTFSVSNPLPYCHHLHQYLHHILFFLVTIVPATASPSSLPYSLLVHLPGRESTWAMLATGPLDAQGPTCEGMEPICEAKSGSMCSPLPGGKGALGISGAEEGHCRRWSNQGYSGVVGKLASSHWPPWEGSLQYLHFCMSECKKEVWLTFDPRQS